MNRKQIIALIAAALVFGLLMGLRSDVQFGWQRAASAGVACGVLGLTILYARTKRG